MKHFFYDDSINPSNFSKCVRLFFIRTGLSLVLLNIIGCAGDDDTEADIELPTTPMVARVSKTEDIAGIWSYKLESGGGVELTKVLSKIESDGTSTSLSDAVSSSAQSFPSIKYKIFLAIDGEGNITYYVQFLSRLDELGITGDCQIPNITFARLVELEDNKFEFTREGLQQSIEILTSRASAESEPRLIFSLGDRTELYKFESKQTASEFFNVCTTLQQTISREAAVQSPFLNQGLADLSGIWSSRLTYLVPGLGPVFLYLDENGNGSYYFEVLGERVGARTEKCLLELRGFPKFTLSPVSGNVYRRVYNTGLTQDIEVFSTRQSSNQAITFLDTSGVYPVERYSSSPNPSPEDIAIRCEIDVENIRANGLAPTSTADLEGIWQASLNPEKLRFIKIDASGNYTQLNFLGSEINEANACYRIEETGFVRQLQGNEFELTTSLGRLEQLEIYLQNGRLAIISEVSSSDIFNQFFDKRSLDEVVLQPICPQ